MIEVVDIITSIQQMTNQVIVFLPNLLAAIVILVIGWIIGRILGKTVSTLLDRGGVDDALSHTSIGRAIDRQYGGAGNRGIVQFFDVIVRWFVYLIAILAAANVLQLEFLTDLVQDIVAFVPNVAVFVIILIVGFIVIDYFADLLRHLGTTSEISMMGPMITILQAFLYFVLVMLALQQLRIDLTIIYIFITPVAWGLGLGLGAAIAIVVGFGLRDRAPELVDSFLGRIRKETGNISAEEKPTS